MLSSKAEPKSERLRFYHRSHRVFLRINIFPLLRCQAAKIGGQLPTLRDNLSVQCQVDTTVGDETDRLPRNVKKIDWTLKIGLIGCLETSVSNCQYKLRNIPEERRSHLHCGGSLKSNLTQERYLCVSEGHSYGILEKYATQGNRDSKILYKYQG